LNQIFKRNARERANVCKLLQHPFIADEDSPELVESSRQLRGDSQQEDVPARIRCSDPRKSPEPPTEPEHSLDNNEGEHSLGHDEGKSNARPSDTPFKFITKQTQA
jgi:hypothetical protein